MITMFSCYLPNFFILDYKQILINNRLSSLIYHNVKLITVQLIVNVIFSVDCFLCNLSEEKKYRNVKLIC